MVKKRVKQGSEEPYKSEKKRKRVLDGKNRRQRSRMDPEVKEEGENGRPKVMREVRKSLIVIGRGGVS